MTNSERVKKSLEKYNFSFQEGNQEIRVKLDFNQQMIISFSESKIIISEKLVGWNFLTGALEMSLKNAMIYNFIATVMFSFLCLFQSSGFNFISLFLGFITWVLMWTVFYLVKSESFKQQVIGWTKE